MDKIPATEAPSVQFNARLHPVVEEAGYTEVQIGLELYLSGFFSSHFIILLHYNFVEILYSFRPYIYLLDSHHWRIHYSKLVKKQKQKQKTAEIPFFFFKQYSDTSKSNAF